MKKINTTRAAVCILAAALLKMGVSQSDAMRQAWETIKEKKATLAVVHATKKDGTRTKRLVTYDYSLFDFKGGKSTLKPNQVFFIDFAKHTQKKYPAISFYQPEIYKLA